MHYVFKIPNYTKKLENTHSIFYSPVVVGGCTVVVVVVCVVVVCVVVVGVVVGVIVDGCGVVDGSGNGSTVATEMHKEQMDNIVFLKLMRL
jgi:hypothetical protein